MSLLVDASICPDCRTPLTGARCPACDLRLDGPLGQEIWQHLVAADAVIQRIRTGPESDPSPGNGSLPPAAPVLSPALSPALSPPRSSARSTPGRTVPALLLGLGGLFVLVAVSLFLAVTWAVLPLSVKALIMAVVTVAMAVGAVVPTRRGLRASAEVLWALTSAIVVLDLDAAWRSGLLGLDALTGREVTSVVGLALVVLGLGVATGARRTPPARVVAAEVALGAGIVSLVGSEVLTGSGSDGPRLVLGTVVLAVVGALLRNRLREVALVALALAVLVWLVLVARGSAGLPDVGRGDYWTGLDGWRLVAAALLAAAPVGLTKAPGWCRTALATAALACLGLAAVLPVDVDSTQQVLLLAAVVTGYVLTSRLARGPWSTASALLSGTGAVVAACALLLVPMLEVLAFVADHAIGTTAPKVRFADPGGPDAWTLLVVLAVGLLAALAAVRELGSSTSAPLRAAVPRTLPGAAVLGTTAVAAGERAPLALVGAGLVLTALVATRGVASVPAAVVSLEASGLALLLATRSDLLTTLVAGVLCAGAVVEHLRRHDRTAPAYGAVVVPLAAWSSYGWTRVAGLDETPQLVVVLLVTGLGLLLMGLRHRRGPADLGALPELTAALSLAVEVLAVADDAAMLALALTLAGSTLALVAVLREDRVRLGWLAGAVLVTATVVRATTDQPHAPELYALPAAALLVVAGSLRMRHSPELGSWRLLGSGLDLALLPSLLIAMDDPASLRGLAVGVGGGVALLSGLWLRWQAPYLLGTGVLAVLALRFLLPLAAEVLADPVGAWLLFGTSGGVLLAAGMLWERSLRRVRTASRFVTRLV